MGWSTWCSSGIIPCLNDFCDENEIKSVADSMANSGLKDLGYNYICLDDCWSDTSRNQTTGEIQPDLSRFPSGMKNLADYLHSKGFKLGVYTDVGNKTCKGGRTGSWVK